MNRQIYLSIFVIFIAAYMINGSRVAFGQDNEISIQGQPTSPSIEGQLSLVKTSGKGQSETNNCGTSSLTQEELLDMLSAIIAHKDLSDEVFVENTLKTKFILRPPLHYGVQDPDEKTYVTKFISNSQVSVHYTVSPNMGGQWALKNHGSTNGGNLELTIGAPFTFHDCGNFTRQEIKKLWTEGDEGVVQSPLVPTDELVRCKFFPSDDKNKFLPLGLKYWLDRDGQKIERIAITQIDPGLLTPVCK